MNGEHHESGERDRRDDPSDRSRALDELSRKEILRALAGLDQRLKADAEDAYSLLARGMLHGRLGDDRRAAEDFSRAIELEPDNAEALENRGSGPQRPGRTPPGQGGLRRPHPAGTGQRRSPLQPGRLPRQAGRPERGRGGLRPGHRAGAERPSSVLQPGLHLRRDGQPTPGAGGLRSGHRP